MAQPRLCGECGQEKPLTDDDFLAARLDCYRSAYGAMKDLYGREPDPFEVEHAARFLAGMPCTAGGVTEADDE